jgi:small-conductance mechanosensitive channel
MWEWFTANSVWILIVSVVVLLLLVSIRGWVHKVMERAALKEKRGRRHRNVSIALWVIGVIALVVIALGLAAIISAEEDAPTLVIDVQSWLLAHGMRILVILAVGVGLWFALKLLLPPLVGRTIVKTKGESKEGIKKRTDTLVAVLMGTGKILIVIVIIFMLLSEFDIPVGPALAGFGVAGIAVGFGAQYLIRDLIAGIFVLMENQYRVGDVVKVADTIGIVEQVNLRRTVLRDLDGIVHHVPNGEIKVASNYTRHFSRVNLNISVAYGTDLDHAINVINRVGQELAADETWSKLIMNKPQVLRVDNLGDSGIDIKILGDVKPMQQWAVMGELRKRIKKTFDEEGIEIPWPHVKIYFGQSQTNEYLTCQACSHPNQPGSKFCSNCGAALSSP